MPTFSQITRGARAVRAIDFPLDNTRCALLPDLPELADARAAQGADLPEAPPDAVRVGVRVLVGSELQDAREKARARARTKGVTDPKPGDDIYDAFERAEVLVRACMVGEDASKPFFDGGADQVLDNLDEDRIAFLYEHWNLWQDECSPQALKFTPEQFYAAVVALADSDVDKSTRFFEQMRPGLRLICMRTLAALSLTSLMPKSATTSESASSGTGNAAAGESAPSESVNG